MNDRPVEPPDPTRRRFFRQFAGDVVSSVGSVLGAAQVLQQQSAEAARELLGTEDGATPATVAAAAEPEPPREEPAANAGFRAAFRWDGDVCRVVDQRRLPDTLVDIEVHGAGDGVAAINDQAAVGSLVQAQLAAVTLALVAGRSVTHRPFARRATVRGAANALRVARPGSAAMATTVDRMLAISEALGLDAEGETIRDALRGEAEAVLREAGDAHGAIVERLVATLAELAPGPAPDADAGDSPRREDSPGPDGDGHTGDPADAGDAPAAPAAPLRVLTLGSTGAMGGGQCGTALSAVIAAHHAERPIRALVAETRPGLEGSRIAAWELRQAGVDHAIVTDAAAPGLIAAGEVDAVLVGADRVAANGDVIAVAGAYPLALAALAAGVPVLVACPTIAIDLLAATGRDAPIEEARPARVLTAGGTRVAPEGTQVRSPVQDLTPASLVAAVVTEAGVARPPFGTALADLVAAARRPAGGAS